MKYPAVTDPVEKVTMLVDNHDSMRVVYLITYVIFGIVLAVLALALYARLKAGAPTLTLVATVAGLIWAVVLVASGMIFNAGVAAVVDLHATSPAQAVSAWQSIEPVAQGLGGSGGELLGGLWVLLVSVAALRTAGLPKMLNWLGVVIGALGVLSSCRHSRTWHTASGCCRSCGSCGWASSCCARRHDRLTRRGKPTPLSRGIAPCPPRRSNRRGLRGTDCDRSQDASSTGGGTGMSPDITDHLGPADPESPGHADSPRRPDYRVMTPSTPWTAATAPTVAATGDKSATAS